MQVHFTLSSQSRSIIRRLSRLTLFCILTVSLVTSTAYAQKGGISEKEYAALVAIYNATGGDSWFINDNWLSSEPVELWYGVTVEEGKVTGLDLSSNNLTGVFPAQTADLPLVNLLLFNNQLTKINALPSSLTLLDANSNLLTKLPTLPAGLTYLAANNNQLNKLPALPASLTFLSVRENNLRCIPRNLPANLEFLSVSHNRLRRLPALPETVFILEASNNRLRTLPVLPGSLNFLSVSNNELTSLPSLPNALEYLDCSVNRLSALPVLPEGLGVLICFSNKLTFEDFEPITPLLSSPEAYAPQDSVGKTTTVKIQQGSSYTLSANFAGQTSNNRYVWFKDGLAITDTLTTPFYKITNATTADAGVYTAIIVNTVVEGLIIDRKPVTLLVNAPATREGLSHGNVALQVYPNPFIETIQLQATEDNQGATVALTIMDVHGREVYSNTAHVVGQPIQLGDDLPNGVYILKVVSGQQTQIFRIVKTK